MDLMFWLSNGPDFSFFVSVFYFLGDFLTSSIPSNAF